MTDHRIVSGPKFVPGTNDGPNCLCTCGWLGLGSHFAAHRGDPTSRKTNSLWRLKGDGRQVSAWTRCRPKGVAGQSCSNCGRMLVEKRSSSGKWILSHYGGGNPVGMWRGKPSGERAA